MASYSTLHPASHRIVIYIYTKHVWASPGTIWALVAASGSQEISIWRVCIYFICFPYGNLMHRGFFAGLIFLIGVPGRTKCPVAPASAMAISTDILMLGVLNIVWPVVYLFKWFVSMHLLLLVKHFYWGWFSYILHRFRWRNHLISHLLVPYCRRATNCPWLIFFIVIVRPRPRQLLFL